jgi:hypothetical protein
MNASMMKGILQTAITVLVVMAIVNRVPTLKMWVG